MIDLLNLVIEKYSSLDSRPLKQLRMREIGKLFGQVTILPPLVVNKLIGITRHFDADIMK